MSDPDIKAIENHIKDLLFKNAQPAPPPIQDNPEVQYNVSPFLFDKNCLLTNVEDAVYKDKLGPSLPFSCNLNKNCSSSQLIDVNVLTNFAAQHAVDSASDLISNTSRVLPHPEFENDLPSSPSRSTPRESTLPIQNMVEDKSPKKFQDNPVNQCREISVSDTYPEPSENAIGSPISKKTRKKKKNKKQAGTDKINRRSQGSNGKKLGTQFLDSPKGSPEKKVEKEDGAIKKESSPVKQKLKIQSREKDAPPPDLCFPEDTASPHRGKEYTLVMLNKDYKFSCHLCNYDSKSKEIIFKHMNSENHALTKDQALVDKMLAFLPKPLPGQVETITKIIMKSYAEHGLHKEDLIMRQELCNRLNDFIQKNVEGCSVEMVGSSASGLGLKISTVDFILKVSQEQDIPDCLELLYKKLLEEDAYIEVESDFKNKRVGILFKDKETGLNCSIVLEICGAEKLSKLLSSYCQLDNRVIILGTVFRYWAKLCGIDNQDRGTLPAYSFSLLLIYFLQQTDPPVLPVLHELKEYSNAEQMEKYFKEKMWKSENTASVGQLWLELFHFYNFSYKMGKHVVCIRHHNKVLLSDKNWSTKFYAIEDPYGRRNIAHVIPNYQMYHYIQRCFFRTYRYFAYPQTRSGEIQILRNEHFDAVLQAQCASSKDEDSDDDAASDNDDSSLPDESNFLPDPEDQDPDLPIENVISVITGLCLDEEITDACQENEVTVGSFEQSDDKPSDQNVAKAESPKKESKKNKEKVAKAEEKTVNISPCSWDVVGEVDPKSFYYKFESTTFKGRKDVPLSCKLCKSVGHLRKNCPNDKLPDPSKLPEMTPEFSKVITRVLYYIRDKNCVDEADKIFMTEKMLEMESHIKKQFPEARLSMFGSFCNGFGFKTRSDMDFCLTFKDQEDGKSLDCTGIIEKVAKLLQQFPKVYNIVPVTSAKVPIVKFAWTESGLEGDISLYNTLAIANTELLEAYSKIDSRVQVLGFALKYFAKVLGICEASRGSLSSYAYILMVIFFLQQRQPPVIPVLQELHQNGKPEETVDGWNVWFYKDIDKLHEVWPDYRKNKETVAELWLALLSFYSYDFDWKEYVVSIRQKALLTRFRKLWITDQIAIEDPFDLNHNLGAGLSRKMNMYILKTFARGRERFGTPLKVDDLNTIYNREVAYLFDRHFLNSGADPPHDRGCRYCGKIGHIAKNCPGKACACCKRLGHLAKNCPWKKTKGKQKNQERNSQEMFSGYNKNIVEPQNLTHGHSVRAQNSSMLRTNSGPADLLKICDNRDESRKLMQMGFSNRHPPPGFTNNIKSPPPGFKSKFSMHANGIINFPRPFAHPGSAPFPRTMPESSHSPPKHYSSSPPKNFSANSAYHSLIDPVPQMAHRPGLLPEPRMAASDPMLHSRIWQSRNQLPPSKFLPQYGERWKRTNEPLNNVKRDW